MGGNCWSRGQKVSLLLRFAQVEFRPSWAPPIAMHSVLCLEGTKSSALRRIALRARTIECWGGVPGSVELAVNCQDPSLQTLATCGVRASKNPGYAGVFTDLGRVIIYRTNRGVMRRQRTKVTQTSSAWAIPSLAKSTKERSASTRRSRPRTTKPS